MTIEDSAIMPEAFFTVDGDSYIYIPGPMTRGPWGAARAVRTSAACWVGA